MFGLRIITRATGGPPEWRYPVHMNAPEVSAS